MSAMWAGATLIDAVIRVIIAFTFRSIGTGDADRVTGGNDSADAGRDERLLPPGRSLDNGPPAVSTRDRNNQIKGGQR